MNDGNVLCISPVMSFHHKTAMKNIHTNSVDARAVSEKPQVAIVVKVKVTAKQ